MYQVSTLGDCTFSQGIRLNSGVDIKWFWVYNSYTMKRYLLFAFSGYYPEGGWNDLQGDYGTLKKAREMVAKLSGHDWYQIVDTKINRILDSGEVKPYENK